jgi:hypothetical protein
VKRLIGGGLGVIFKGSGFYSTDNKRGSALGGGNGAASKDKEKAPAKASETGSTAPAAEKASKPDKSTSS